MSGSEHDTAALAERLRSALEGAEIGDFGELLAPDAYWGPPDDDTSGCHGRDEVVAWWARARDAGVRAVVTELVPGDGTFLVGVRVTGRDEQAVAGGETDRWQVIKLRDGLIVDIRGFEERATAADRAGVR